MIVANVKITADTEEHFQEIVDTVFHNLKRGISYNNCEWIWPHSTHSIDKDQECKHLNIQRGEQNSYCLDCGFFPLPNV